MNLPIYQIDAFTDTIFSGNPAAVCPLEKWLDDTLLQKIAQENNLSETAFFVNEKDQFSIRWFSPSMEIDLCGHATLAAAYVIFHELAYTKRKIIFYSKSGKLLVHKNNELLTLVFPAQPPTVCNPPRILIEGLSTPPLQVLAATDYIAVYKNENEIAALVPNMDALKQLELRGLIVTAKSNNVDFVCRFFAPKCGIEEDPVTGSAFCELTPYWSKILGKKTFHARQLSKRQGEVFCSIEEDRIYISGNAVKFMEGTITM